MAEDPVAAQIELRERHGPIRKDKHAPQHLAPHGAAWSARAGERVRRMLRGGVERRRTLDHGRADQMLPPVEEGVDVLVALHAALKPRHDPRRGVGGAAAAREMRARAERMLDVRQRIAEPVDAMHAAVCRGIVCVELHAQHIGARLDDGVEHRARREELGPDVHAANAAFLRHPHEAGHVGMEQRVAGAAQRHHAVAALGHLLHETREATLGHHRALHGSHAVRARCARALPTGVELDHQVLRRVVRHRVEQLVLEQRDRRARIDRRHAAAPLAETRLDGAAHADHVAWRIEHRAHERPPHLRRDLHADVLRDRVLLRARRLVGQQPADRRAPAALRELPHQRALDEHAAQPGRRLVEHDPQEFRPRAVPAHERVASVLARHRHERPFGPDDDRCGHAEPHHRLVHRACRDHLVVHGRVGDSATPRAVGPEPRARDRGALRAERTALGAVDLERKRDGPAIDDRVEIEALGCDQDDRRGLARPREPLERPLHRRLSCKRLCEAARRPKAAVPRIDRHHERGPHLGRRARLAERAGKRALGARGDRGLVGLLVDRATLEPAHRRLEHRRVLARALLDPPHVREVALELQPLLLVREDAARLLDAAVGLGTLQQPDLAEVVEQPQRVEPLAHLRALGVDGSPEPLFVRSPRCGADQLRDRLARAPRCVVDDPHVGEDGAEALRRGTEPRGVERAIGQRNRSDFLARVRCQRLGKGLHLGAGLAHSALGRIDGAQSAPLVLQEEVLEALEVRLHLRIRIDRLALHVASLHEVRAVPRDASPLEVLDGVERIQLGRPHVVDRRAAGVVDAVGETEVLPDERDRVAAEEPRDLVAEMGDGGTRRQPAVLARERPEQRVKVRRRDGPHGPGIALRDHWIGLRIEDERGVGHIAFAQALVEAPRDLMPVERGDEVRTDALREQRLEHRLRGDDHAALTDAGPREQVEVPTQARSGAYHDAKAVAGDSLERRDALAPDVEARISQDRADRVRAARKPGGRGHARGADGLGQVLREVLYDRRKPRPARGMLDDLYALHKHAFRACKALGKAAERLEAREQQHIRLREGGAPVGALEHSTKKRKIGLDDDDEPRPTEARAELGDMEAGAKPEDRDDRLVAEIDRLGEIDRFLAGCMP